MQFALRVGERGAWRCLSGALQSKQDFSRFRETQTTGPFVFLRNPPTLMALTTYF